MARTNITQLGRALAKVSTERARLMELSQYLELGEILSIAEKIPLEKWGHPPPHSPLYEADSNMWRYRSHLIRAHNAELPSSAFVVSLVRKGLEKPKFYSGGEHYRQLEDGRFATSLLLSVKYFGRDDMVGIVPFGMLEAKIVGVWEKKSSGDDHSPIDEYERIEDLYNKVRNFYFKRLES